MVNVTRLVVRTPTLPGFSSAVWDNLELTTRDFHPKVEHEDPQKSLEETHAMLSTTSRGPCLDDDAKTFSNCSPDAVESTHYSDMSVPQLKDKNWLYSHVYLQRSCDRELMSFLQSSQSLGHLSVFMLAISDK